MLKKRSSNKLFIVCLLVIVSTFSVKETCSQTISDVPQEFKFASVNSKATEKDFEFTVDENSSSMVQNFVLDKTGFFLHIIPKPKLKDKNIQVKIIDEEGSEIEIFPFKDSSLFALLNPEKTYSIVKEIVPNCQELSSSFELEETSAICPDKVLVRVLPAIMIAEDTSINLNHEIPLQLFASKITFPQELVEDTFQIVKIKNQEESIDIPETINIANLTNFANLCIKSRTKTRTKLPNTCLLDHPSVNTIVFFNNSFKNIKNADSNLSLIFPLPKGEIRTLEQDILLEINQTVNPKDEATQINKSIKNSLFLEGFNITLNENIGKLNKQKTKFAKNIFNLNAPLEISKSLNKTTLSLPLDSLEGTINLGEDISPQPVLTKLQLQGLKDNLQELFLLTFPNNIILQNEEEENENISQKLAFQTNENFEFDVYLPADIFNLILNRTYSLIEQNTAPSVNELGESIEVVNDKSRLDINFKKQFNAIDTTNSTSPISLKIKAPSKILEDKPIFNNLFLISGFLIPPDFRPVVEDNYRATILFSTFLPLTKEETLDINYSELKTKDEVKLTNFFKFSFLPQGIYNAKITFDGSREAIFKSTGILKN